MSNRGTGIFRKLLDAFRYPGTRSPQAMFNKNKGESLAAGTQTDWNPTREGDDFDESKFTPFASGNLPGHGGYRHPAPGGAAIASAVAGDGIDVPTATPDKMYDIKYFSRDTRRSRVHNDRDVMTHPSLGIEGNLVEPPRLTGSPGTFANPAVKTYDETGLRSAMSATHEETNASIAKYLPTHLPTPAWANDPDTEGRMLAEEQAGLPPVPGYAAKWDKNVMSKAREYKW
eukprot:g628.t1